MVGEKLHEYDLCLCNYVLGNVREHLDEKEFAEWVQEQVSPPALLKYVLDKQNPYGDAEEWLLLNEKELDYLIFALQDPLAPSREWRPYEALHGRYVETVKEVRDQLSKQVAEDWSTACAGFARRLEGGDVPLLEGLEIMREWLRHLRRLLHSMDASFYLPCPEGRSPTPTCPPTAGSSVAVVPGKPATSDIERMQQAIQQHPNGKDATATSLVKAAKINHQRGRDALRWLQNHGEYTGLIRDRPVRFKEGRPNEK